jgi:hypothetical protein
MADRSDAPGFVSVPTQWEFENLLARVEAIERYLQPDPPVDSGFVLGVNVDGGHYWSTGRLFSNVMHQATMHYGAYRAFWDSPDLSQKEWRVIPEGWAELDTRYGLQISTMHPVEDVIVTDQVPIETFVHPNYLKAFSWARVLRFMDAQKTNDSPPGTWEDRITPTSTRQGDRTESAIPLEHLCRMAEEMDAVPWFCVPHLANEGYMRNMAELIASYEFETVFIEYSNEVWNFVFPQAQWLHNHLHGGWGPESLDEWAKRVALMAQTFKTYLPGVKIVLAGQEANSWVAGEVAKRLGRGGFDVLATTAYFDSFGDDLDAVVENAYGSILRRDEKRLEHAALAEEYGVPYVAYEGGSHYVGVLNKEFKRSPRIKPILKENINSFRQAGGVVYLEYVDIKRYSGAHAWGVLEHGDQETSPTLEVLKEYADG